MKERPILFSKPMVLAILAGTKTQTRRAVRGVKHFPDWGSAVGMVGGAWRYGSPAGLDMSDRGDNWSVTLDADHLRRMCTREAYGWGAGAGCPYGQPGDRLWVREAWRTTGDGGRCNDMPPRDLQAHEVWYEADGHAPSDECAGKLRPSMFMPRWASRITLEVTGVRVERLQDISEADAMEEGIHQHPATGWFSVPGINGSGTTARAAYALLWNSINGAGSWDANPWVWCVEFKRMGPA